MSTRSVDAAKRSSEHPVITIEREVFTLADGTRYDVRRVRHGVLNEETVA
jgi:hypothetical protein